MALETSVSNGQLLKEIPIVKEVFQEALVVVQDGYRAVVQMKGNAERGGPKPTAGDGPVEVDGGGDEMSVG
jgi:hypothetical protein